MRVPRAVPQGYGTGPARPAPAAAPAAQVKAPPAPRRARPPRAPFLLLVVGLLCGGLVSLLLLNAVLARDSYKANGLNNEINGLRIEKESKQSAIMRQEMPAAVARNNELQGLGPDWDTARVIDPDRPAVGAAGDVKTPAGQERVPGTGQ
ncbi:MULTISPECIES: hypothetical protein [unclassified Streptosporangium]|uniref:hypothetical protein n=1 Tax=unclassified Streptosporangium TaxID=2632669 RepID=UPI002E2C940B|nr:MULTISPECIES: hypothetical protein [unclassified Streptosporangium]